MTRAAKPDHESGGGYSRRAAWHRLGCAYGAYRDSRSHGGLTLGDALASALEGKRPVGRYRRAKFRSQAAVHRLF